MATLYVEELATMGLYGAAQIAARPGVAAQTVAIGGSSTQSSAFNAQTKFIRVHTDAICSIAIGSNPTATTSNCRLAADQTEYFGVQPGDKIAVISNT